MEKLDEIYREILKQIDGNEGIYTEEKLKEAAIHI